MSDLERDFMTRVEHEVPDWHERGDQINCWCHHPDRAHRPDPMRDFRELCCDECGHSH